MERGHRWGSVASVQGRVARRIVRVGLLIATLLVVNGAEPASAMPQPHLSSGQAALQSTGAAGPTPAWIKFCERLPQECAVDLSEPDMIALDQQIWDTIVQINERVNGAILSVADQDHWGVVDRWDYPDDGLGDCEDIQLLKRKLLVDTGLPRRALRMTVAIDEQDAGHAVLIVRTDFGDFILDNKKDAVLPWLDTGYSYVKREGSDGLDWVSLVDQTAPVITGNR
jgi:predicted transglutaminase-like cysteine proteinase